LSFLPLHEFGTSDLRLSSHGLFPGLKTKHQLNGFLRKTPKT
jgi:hypothetical protein